MLMHFSPPNPYFHFCKTHLSPVGIVCTGANHLEEHEGGEDEGYQTAHGSTSQTQHRFNWKRHTEWECDCDREWECDVPLGMRMAMVRVRRIMEAVMRTNLFLGIGSCTCSSRALLEKKRALMLTRHGKIIRGKLTTTDSEKPGETVT